MECCIEIFIIIIIHLGIILCLGNLLSWDNSLLSEHIDGYLCGIFTEHRSGRAFLDVDSVPLLLQSITASNKMPYINFFPSTYIGKVMENLRTLFTW